MNSRKEEYIPENNYSIKENYEILSQLGKGGYGRVLAVRHKKTGVIRACKFISKAKIKERDLNRTRLELKILKKADHPNIVKIYEIYETENSLYIIMEKCNGGELFDKIIDNIGKKKMFSEKEAAKILIQIMSAINYCHKNGICHRDLKPENILLLNKEDNRNYQIKLIDFGLSHLINGKQKSRVGTAYYVSPEVLKGEYTEKCDIWSAGVILCILLTGEPPFNGPDDNVIYNKIRNYCYNFSDKWKPISNEVKDLISHMLVPENRRYNSDEVLGHPWIQKYMNDNDIENIETNNLNENINCIKNYSRLNDFSKNILNYIASKIDENNYDKNLNRINQYFKLFDKNNDGEISFEEFQKPLVNINIEENEIKDLFNSLDISKNGVINYTEFIAAFLETDFSIKNELEKEAFAFFEHKNNQERKELEELMDEQ